MINQDERYGIWYEKADPKLTILVDQFRMNGHILEYRVLDSSGKQYWLPAVSLCAWYERPTDAN